MIAVYIFILGLMFGSFYNVVGMRLSNNESIVFPGSHCEKCNHKLKWYENIPLFSYILLKGKCSNCHTKISVWYPATELFTGMLFLISYYTFGISLEFLIAIILSSLTTIIFVSDINYYIILDSPIIIGSILIIIIKLFMEPFINVLYSIGSGILIFAIMYTIMLLGNLIFKKESLGGGDIKLSFIAGLVLGPKLGIFYIIFGAFLAFPYAIYVTIRNKDNMLPFGPFLISSLLIIYLDYEFFLNFLNTLLHIS